MYSPCSSNCFRLWCACCGTIAVIISITTISFRQAEQRLISCYILHLQREPCPFRIRHRNIIINAAPVPGNSDILFSGTQSLQHCRAFPPALINRRIEAVIVVRIIIDIAKVSLCFPSVLIRIEIPGNHPLQRRCKRVPPSFRQFVVHPCLLVNQQLGVEHFGVRLEMDFGDGIRVIGNAAEAGVLLCYHQVEFDVLGAFADSCWFVVFNIYCVRIRCVFVKLNLIVLSRNNNLGEVHRDVALVFIRRCIVRISAWVIHVDRISPHPVLVVVPVVGGGTKPELVGGDDFERED